LLLETLPSSFHVLEREAELRVLFLPPSRTHPDLHATAADLVDRRDGLREQPRGPERDGRDEGSETDTRCPGGERSEQRPRGGAPPTRHATSAEVVVGAEQPLEAEPFTGVRDREPVVPAHALLALDHHAHTHRRSLAADGRPSPRRRGTRTRGASGA